MTPIVDDAVREPRQRYRHQCIVRWVDPQHPEHRHLVTCCHGRQAWEDESLCTEGCWQGTCETMMRRLYPLMVVGPDLDLENEQWAQVLSQAPLLMRTPEPHITRIATLCTYCGRRKVNRHSTTGQLVCPVHCSKCGHDRRYEDHLDFCSQCGPDDACYRGTG